MDRNEYDKELMKWANDHYWDSLEKDKHLIFIKKYAWVIVMAWAFAVAGWSFMNWQFYAAIIPIIALEEWKTY